MRCPNCNTELKNIEISDDVKKLECPKCGYVSYDRVEKANPTHSTNGLNILGRLCDPKHTWTKEELQYAMEANEYWDWEKYRRETAAKVLSGMVVNNYKKFTYTTLANEAVLITDSLIKILKMQN